MFGLRKNEDKTEMRIEKEMKKKVEHLGSTTLKKGHTLWEIHKKTGAIVEAEYHKKDVHYDNVAKHTKSVIVKDGCFYVGALNKKNAAKKFFKEVIKIQKGRK